MKNRYFLFILFILSSFFFSCSNLIKNELATDLRFNIKIPENKAFSTRSTDSEELTLSLNLISKDNSVTQNITKKVSYGQTVQISFNKIPVGTIVKINAEISSLKTVLYVGESNWHEIKQRNNEIRLTLKNYQSEGTENLINAETPQITIQPNNAIGIATEGSGTSKESKLTIAAQVTDGGSISFQWQIKNDDTWTNISEEVFEEEISAPGITVVLSEFSVTLNINESRIYRCIVTNTNQNVNGNKTASITSDEATVAYVEGTLTGISASYEENAYQLFSEVFDYKNVKVIETYASENNSINVEVRADSIRYTISKTEDNISAIGYVPYTVTLNDTNTASNIRVPVKYNLPTAGLKITETENTNDEEWGTSVNPELVAQYTGTATLSVGYAGDGESSVPYNIYEEENSESASDYDVMTSGVDIAWNNGTVTETLSYITIDNTNTGTKTYTATLTPKTEQAWCIGNSVSASYYVEVCPWEIKLTEASGGTVVFENLTGGTEYNLSATNEAGTDGTNITWESNNGNFTISDSTLTTPAATADDQIATISAKVGEQVIASVTVTVKKLVNKNITYAGYDTITNLPIFYIYDAEGLETFRDIVNGTTTLTIPPDTTIPDIAEYNITSQQQAIKGVLKNDIDLSENSESWIPIGTSEKPFSGVFDGENHTILGINITQENDAVGFFGCISSMDSNTKITIKNLVLNGEINFTGTKDCFIGGFSGVATNVTFENCVNNININYENYGYSYIGGIVGQFNGCSFNNCINLANISTSERSGGIAGVSNSDDGALTSTFDKCINLGDIIVSSNAGGIIGYDSATELKITNCLNLGTIGNDGSTATYISGIIGYGNDDPKTVTCCLNTGRLLGTAFLYAIDSTSDGTNYTNNYYDNSVNAGEIEDSQSTCSPLSTESLRNGELLQGWNTEDWSFENGRYPLPNIGQNIPGGVDGDIWHEIVSMAKN